MRSSTPPSKVSSSNSTPKVIPPLIDVACIDQQYTIEWQRRIFRKIGEYLRRHNVTIQKCFNLIDEDHS
jgi:hypothetical protein